MLGIFQEEVGYLDFIDKIVDRVVSNLQVFVVILDDCFVGFFFVLVI